MANIKSAVKRVELTRKRTLRNKQIKSSLKTTIKKFEVALETAGKEEAGLKFRNAVKVIDKAVTKGVLHKRTAARKKSRLAGRLNQKTG